MPSAEKRAKMASIAADKSKTKGMDLPAFTRLLALDGRGQQDPARLFGALDEDGDGRLTSVEFSALATLAEKEL